MIPKQEESAENETFLFLGASPAMEEVKEIVERVAGTDLIVLIRGESGTGKGLLAQSIHATSSRRAGPFVTVNCVAIRGELLESKLFGHEAGSFPGEQHARQGKFELARGGTIFLDNIDEVDLPLRARLLAAFHDGRFSPRQGTEGRPDARVIASAHQKLEAVGTPGTFREDPDGRPDVVGIYLPPLRERREEIPWLVIHFSSLYSRLYHRKCPQFSTRTLELFGKYPWPGNVRELENAVKRAVLLGDEEAIAGEIWARREENGSRIRSGAHPDLRSDPNGKGNGNGSALPFSLNENG